MRLAFQKQTQAGFVAHQAAGKPPRQGLMGPGRALGTLLHIEIAALNRCLQGLRTLDQFLIGKA